MTAHISTKRDVLATFCRRRHISRLAVFGAATRGDFRPDSDVGVLVEFEDGHVPGLDFMTIERELSKLLNHQVDLITRKFVIPWARRSETRPVRRSENRPPEGRSFYVVYVDDSKTDPANDSVSRPGPASARTDQRGCPARDEPRVVQRITMPPLGRAAFACDSFSLSW